jgi:hypothetical protein
MKACTTYLVYFLALLSSTAQASISTSNIDQTSVVIAPVENKFWLRECVPPFKSSGFSTSDQSVTSNYVLRNMTHGLCADHLSCAFKDCEWTDAAKSILEKSDLETVRLNGIKDQLPPFNLPARIAFPVNARQLIAAVNSARNYKLGLISVKTSGHSYAGSSTMLDSTLIYLRSLKQYSAKGIVECNNPSVTSNACKLALARGKKAIIRVGGGEAHDNVYRAVIAWNEKHPDSSKYTVIGGGAGTVAAAGGWLQGGGLSTGLERLFGLGVDQILEIEMVLADGTHIKFGPTKWVRDKGFIYPRTTQVVGYCNKNVVDDESKWKWATCEKSIPFDDLWFAVRGGGGGTYGIVTAVQVQLHPYRPLYYVQPNMDSVAAIGAACEANDCSTFDTMFYNFFLDFFFNPKNLDLKEETSNACGHAGMTISTSAFSGFWCDGNDATVKMLQAWNTYATAYASAYPYLLAPLQSLFYSDNVDSYAALLIQIRNSVVDFRGVPFGHVFDSPAPEVEPGDGYSWWSALVPLEWLKQKNEEVLYFIDKVAFGCHLIGGWSNLAHDQATSINPIERISGLQCNIDVALEEHYRAQFLPYYPASSGMFPGGTEYNHIHPTNLGPLKTNWTQPCPSTFTKAKKRKQCVSLAESVWGTEILSKLQATKKAVDPTSAFNCHFCVGEKD